MGLKGGQGLETVSLGPFEIISDRPQAEVLLTYLQAKYYSNYAMVACFSEVGVLRPQGF